MPSKKKAAKKPKRRLDIPRPYSSGLYTEAGMRAFAMSALRRARWGPKVDVIKRAFVRKGINPETGMPCALHKCEACGGEFPKGKMKSDHVQPVIPISHNWAADPRNFLGYDFNEVMRRLWIEVGEGWSVICEACHNAKSAAEKAERARHAAISKQPPQSDELL